MVVFFELLLNCRTGGCREQFLPLSAGAGLLIIVVLSVPRFVALSALPGVEILRFLLRVGFGVDVEGCLLRSLSFGGEIDVVLCWAILSVFGAIYLLIGDGVILLTWTTFSMRRKKGQSQLIKEFLFSSDTILSDTVLIGCRIYRIVF